LSEIVIRQATSADVEDVSAIIIRAVHETNAQDYASEIIEFIIAHFSPANIAARMANRLMLVATIDDEIIGTASLHKDTVRNVYIRPDHQGRGIGAALMQEIEEQARANGLETMAVPSSVTAEGFYRKRGFVPVRDQFYGAVRTVLMAKVLGL